MDQCDMSRRRKSGSGVHAAYLMLIAVTVSGCSKPADQQPRVATTATDSAFQFQNLTDVANIKAAYSNGREGGLNAILESLGGGVGVLDFDCDGQMDMVFPGGGSISAGSSPIISGKPLACYRSHGTFVWDNASQISGVDAERSYTHGVAVGDFNNDGFPDFAVTAYAGIDLWHNNGDGTFQVSSDECGLVDSEWSSSCGWGDLDGDSTLDLYVAHYVNWSLENNPACSGPPPENLPDVCPPRRFDGISDDVFQNLADGQFQNASTAWGLKPEGKGLGVLLADLDNDGDTDVYVANDTTDNFLYINDGNGQLKENGLQSGAATDADGRPNGSMGLALFDFDDDQSGDLWVTNFEQETFGLYQNVGGSNFLHASRDTGITSLGGLFVGFGTVACDFDADGDRDIVVANGHVVYHPGQALFAQQSIVMENTGQRSFRRAEFGPESYFTQYHTSRGVAAADFDNDGLQDLVVTQLDAGAQVLKNTTATDGRRIRLRLTGTSCNRDAVSARVVVKSKDNVQTQFVVGGGSYLSASDTACDFYVTDDDAGYSATIFWPGGASETIDGLQSGREYRVIQNRGRVELPI